MQGEKLLLFAIIGLMRKIGIVLFIFVILAGIVFLYRLQGSGSPPAYTRKDSSPIPTKPQEFKPFTASFAIFTNGTFRIFTASMYHNRSKDVFITADNPNIVRVQKTGIAWGDFFDTLPMQLTKTCLVTGTKQTFCTNEGGTLRFYINGKQKTDALEEMIRPGDQLLVSYGNESQEEIEQQLRQVPRPK